MLSQIKAAWTAGSENNISLIAAGIAHYALLALVPALAALVLAYGVFADPETVTKHIAALYENLPPSASELIGKQLRNVSEGAEGAQGLGLIASLAVALFGARSAARALMTGLNIAFSAGEDRGLVRGNLVALGLTLAAIVGLAAITALSAALSIWLGTGGTLASLVLLAVSAAGGSALVYRYVPNKPEPSWEAIWPGAALFAVGWLGATAAFAFYAANFGSYNATYGSLGAVIVLITWFYLSALILLLGAHLAANKERVKRDSAAKAS